MTTPRFIELQLSGTTLAGIVRSRASSQVFFAPDPVQISNPSDGIIDHISFDVDPGIILSPQSNLQNVRVAGGGTFQVTSPKVRIQLGLHIFPKYIAVAQDPSKPENDYAPLPDGLPATLSLDISLSGQPGSTEICLQPADLTSSLQVPTYLAALQQILTQLQSTGPICVPFQITNLVSLLGSIKAQNLVMAAQVDGVGNVTTIGLRIEIGDAPAATPSDWQAFVNGFTASLSTEGPDWNVLIDPQSVVDLATGELQSGLSNLSGYTPGGPVTGQWIVPGEFGGGQIAFSNNGQFAVNQCPNNIGCTISGTIDLEFSGGKLREHGFIDWDLADGDVFVCGLTYGGPVGAIIGTIIAPVIGTIIGGLIGSVVGAIVAAIIASVISGKQTLVGNFKSPSCTVTDQHHVLCTTSVSLPPIDFGLGVRATLSIASITGTNNGLLLGGKAEFTPGGDPYFEISTPMAEVTYGITGNCFQFQGGYNFELDLIGSDGPPGGPTTSCYGTSNNPEIEILNDPLNLYSFSLNPDDTSWLPLKVIFTFDVPQNSPYFTNPYQPTLYVRTTSGAYSVLLPKLLPYTDADLQAVKQEILDANISCNKEASGWLGQPGRFNPHWAVDPGPEGDLNIWEIIAPINPGEVVSVVNPAAVQLAAAYSAGMAAQLSLGVSGVDAKVGAAVPLIFTRTNQTGAVTAAGAAAATAKEAHVDEQRVLSVVVQRSLRLRSTWSALGGELRRISMGVYGNHLCAILAGSGGVQLVNVRIPNRPSVAAILPEAVDAMPFGAGLLSWGHGGLNYDNHVVMETPVTALVVCAGYVYALTPSGLEIFNDQLQHAGTVTAGGVIGMVGAGAKLVLANASGLTIYDLTSPAQPRLTQNLPLDGVLGIELAASGGGRALAELRTGQFAVVDVSGERPYLAATYFQRPWFVGAATLNDVTVCPAGPADIQVFTPGIKKTLCF